ncbi:hypothetical protein M002_27590 [Pseudomonas aeruginosa ID4365]|nr:hypothetical protein M002_27590 [Pseudomonas aeruginosa ID4365]
MQTIGSPREIEFFGNGDKVAQVAKVHFLMFRRLA